jgi:hypothetical protein
MIKSVLGSYIVQLVNLLQNNFKGLTYNKRHNV